MANVKKNSSDINVMLTNVAGLLLNPGPATMKGLSSSFLSLTHINVVITFNHTKARKQNKLIVPLPP